MAYKVYEEPCQTFLKFLEPLSLKYKHQLLLEVLKVWHVVSLSSCNTRNNLSSHEIARCHKNESHH